MRTGLIWGVGGAAFLLATLLPLLWPEWFASPLSDSFAVQWAFRILLLLTPPLLAWVALPAHEGTRRERLFSFFLVLLAAAFCEQVHHQFVDRGSYFGGGFTNAEFQAGLQRGVMALDPQVIPHSYRFLSHSVVGLLQWLTGSLEFARGVYRIMANVLFLAVTLRYARLHLTRPGAVAVVLLFVLLYPITVAWYAGQPVDPLSHLSFAACLYFLTTRHEAGFAVSLLLGLMAKESVAVMAFVRGLYGERRGLAVVLAGLYFVGALLVLGVIRYFVNGGTFSYDRISGVGLTHLWANLQGIHAWGPQYLFSLGIVLPGAIAGWKLMDRTFQLTTLFLTVSLVGSSLLFSWLSEIRNLVPALILLLIINVRWVEQKVVWR